MSLSRTLRLQISDGFGQLELGYNVALAAEGAEERSIAVPHESTDMEVALVIDHEQLVSLFIHSTKAVKIETNSSSAPADTFTLKAGCPLVWYADGGLPNPFSVDVTKIYITNALLTAANDAVVELRMMLDATP